MIIDHRLADVQERIAAGALFNRGIFTEDKP